MTQRTTAQTTVYILASLASGSIEPTRATQAQTTPIVEREPNSRARVSFLTCNSVTRTAGTAQSTSEIIEQNTQNRAIEPSNTLASTKHLQVSNVDNRSRLKIDPRHANATTHQICTP
ncbi:hypothetical protein AJ79_04547 [Helicocarpus griseus UAMH5409]|uniref:Uncharacterized protein n=1 Tax=Helicocarpus griseus UAMH5409 TaxID=1447875 RepID=A0A2B7XTW5_9EURO|nr:hypothetical protein AJ79_04547 [Helicocarpus griseus UAMH5409]